MARATQTRTNTTTTTRISFTNPFVKQSTSSNKKSSVKTTSTVRKRCPSCGKYMGSSGRR